MSDHPKLSPGLMFVPRLANKEIEISVETIFDLKSRSKRLMSSDVAYCIVPWYQVCECNSLRDMTI